MSTKDRIEPGKRTTRLTSKALADAMATASQLKAKREYYEKLVKRIKIQIEDDASFLTWSKGELNERVKRLKEANEHLLDIHMQMICEETDENETLSKSVEEYDDVIMNLNAKLEDRIEALNKTNSAPAVLPQTQPVRIEVQQTDASGNVPNTWGTFDGDYAKWNSFRDRWLTLHENDKVKTVVKFTNLKTACVGKAEGAIADWDLTDDNYERAWERLKSIYEDDYMQIQSFMQMLNKLPQMRNSSSQSIRELIDTVHKHIHGVKRYIKMDENHPYVVFTVIDRMDTETYRAWEKHRPSLAKANNNANVTNEPNANAQNANDQTNHNKTGKHIPTWKQLEEFLEGEVTIRVHAEKRDAFSRSDAKAFTQKRNKHHNGKNNANKDEVPEFLQCVLCNGTHPIYKCESFKAMSLVGRKNHVTQHDLCERCLRKKHNGSCAKKWNNEQCPRCKPTVKFHNSMICPNFELSTKMAMLTRDDTRVNKRKGRYNRNFNAKKRRYDIKQEETTSSNTIASSVSKVGNWSVVNNRSNAIKHTNNKGAGNFEYTVVLATINMQLQVGTNSPVICRAIADTGAMINCITKQFVENNALQTMRCQKVVLGVSGPEIIKRKLRAIMQPWFESEAQMLTDFFILNNLDGLYPQVKIEASKEEIRHLRLADENFDEPREINALLSADVYANIIGDDLYRHNNGAIMQSTSFGHIILGKCKVKKQFISEFPALNVILNNETENESIEKLLTKFWEIEKINCDENKELLSEEHKLVEDIFARTHYRELSGRYVVRIPIKPDCKGLGESRSMALKQFLQLERRLSKNTELKSKYLEYIKEFQNKGYMRLANKQYNSKFVYYLPHHAVEKKFRVVVNASAKTRSGESLNSIQMTGAKIQYDAQLQIMRFRRYKIGVTTDITKMFNRIGLHPDQWDMQRFLWRNSPNEELKEYVITVVMFGLKSSAYNAVRTLNQCAKDQEMRFPKAAEVIQSCFYMDDGTFGCDTVDEAKLLCKEIEFILQQGGFELKAWASNSKAVETHMNADSIKVKIMGEDDETKILGLCWLKTSDELAVFVRQLNVSVKMTKRVILSEIARLHDPNGFVAPIIVKAKMLMQEIWKLKNVKKGKLINFDWDDKVPENIECEWQQYRSDLALLNNFKIKRWINMRAKQNLQIHAFCDASEKAYGAVIYTRVVDEFGKVHTSLLSSKSRVAPIEKISIPRLELLAAVVLSEHLEAIIEACEFQNAEITLWSDSSVVLHWLAKQPQDLKAFVANRVKIIQEKTNKYEWKHVSSGDNPADLVSRGMKMNDFIKSKIWIEGPEWLKWNEERWPKPKVEISPNAKIEIKQECKANVNTMQTIDMSIGDDRTILYNKFNDWDKVVNITAYALRLIEIVMRRARKENDIVYSKFLNMRERNKAIEFWVKFEQRKAFKKEFECLKAGNKLPQKSGISSLRPMLDENDIFRVGGRIDKANIPYGKRHQYIIPYKSRLSYLLLDYAHKLTLHGGAQIMIQFIRKRFWIPKLRAEAKRYINSCKQCVVQAQATAKQVMAELPEVRIKPAHPFKNVGVDMAGPYHMRLTDKVNMNTRMRSLPEIKGWVAVFVCLVTRAVHLEPTEGMSTDDFLNAYQRFVSRRGNPELVFSDHGTNFTGADNELQRAHNTWKDDKIQRFASISGTEWRFITPSAPHEGGIWEAAVKSMKHHLKRVMGTQKYSLQGITTLLASVEACLNSRPLCVLSDDPEDTEALTPAHFLIGRSLKLPMHEKIDSPPYNAKRLFMQLQFQVQAFWKKWSCDYLHSLTQLPKWREEIENLKIGQLVLIKSDNIPPTYWAMGRIIKVHTSVDGKVRSVTLKTQLGELDRSIRKLCVLPCDIELSYWK